jgi:hypothetical protein
MAAGSAHLSSRAFDDLGSKEDLYYSDPKNCKVEAIPVEYNTRFTQNFQTLGPGTNVFVIPPGNGLKHCVLVFGWNKGALSAQTGVDALPLGFGYQAIEQISFRIGGSSQYFLSGQQLLARNLRMVRTQNQAQSILELGGAASFTAADLSGADHLAYIPVSIWSAPSDDGLGVPLPGDTLAQQVQITVQIKPVNQIFSLGGSSGNMAVAAPAFSVGYFQQEQLTMVDRGMAISNHVDLNTHELTMPLPTFDQQELQVGIPIGSSAQGSQITLTGFRSGQVKRIQMWLTKDSDTDNPLLWYAPKAVTILYAGTIYSQYNNGTSRIFNLLDGTKPSAVNYTSLVYTPGSPGTWTPGSVLSEYVNLPFGNASGSDYEANVITNGKEILNGLVNAIVTVPDTAAAWTVHVVYTYNCTAVFSKSTCELRF